jgi:hypothetical protein
MDTGLDGVDDSELDGEVDGELGAEVDLDEGDEGVGDRVFVHGGVIDGNVVFGVYRGVFKIGVVFFFGWGIGKSFCVGALLLGPSMLIRLKSILFNLELSIVGGGIILSTPPVIIFSCSFSIFFCASFFFSRYCH